MAVFVAFGAAGGSLAGSMPTVTAAAGIGSFALGLAMTAWTLANVAAMWWGGRLARHRSHRAVLLVAIPAFGLLTMALLASHAAPMFFAAYLLLGVAMGLTDVFMNAEGAAIEHDLGRPIFNSFHASVSLGLMVFAALASLLAASAGIWATAIAVAAMMAGAWLLVYRWVPARNLLAGRRPPALAIANRQPLVLLGLTAGLSIMAELSAILWSAKLLTEQAPQLAAVAGLGAAFFGLCNGAVRLRGDRLRARFGELPLMMGSIAVAITGFVAIGMSQSFALSVAGFAAVGFGTAVLVPCVFALAAGLMPENRAAGIGFVALAAGLPRAMGPWIFGWTAAAASLSAAFGLVAIGLAIAMALVMKLHRAVMAGESG